VFQNCLSPLYLDSLSFSTAFSLFIQTKVPPSSSYWSGNASNYTGFRRKKADLCTQVRSWLLRVADSAISSWRWMWASIRGGFRRRTTRCEPTLSCAPPATLTRASPPSAILRYGIWRWSERVQADVGWIPSTCTLFGFDCTIEVTSFFYVWYITALLVHELEGDKFGIYLNIWYLNTVYIFFSFKNTIFWFQIIWQIPFA
jgi:hypothetical protein